MEVGVELEDLEQPSSPLPGDDVPLIQREGEPAPESFENRENKHDGQRTSILTRQTSGKLEGTSQRTVTQESVIKETEEHTKSTFVSVVQRNIDDNPFIEPLPEKQDPDIPTPKDHLTREKQAELRRLDDLEAADRGYTPRMNVEEMVFLSMAILHPSSIYIHHLHPPSSPIIYIHCLHPSSAPIIYTYHLHPSSAPIIIIIIFTHHYHPSSSPIIFTHHLRPSSFTHILTNMHNHDEEYHCNHHTVAVLSDTLKSEASSNHRLNHHYYHCPFKSLSIRSTITKAPPSPTTVHQKHHH